MRSSTAIVKIEARFNNDKTGHSIWKIGTGLLIRPDLLVTAGDVVYDAEYRLGAATQIKCYVGHKDRTPTRDSHMQPRYGRKVVTSTEWIDGPDQRSRDIAFIQVEPFAIDTDTDTSFGVQKDEVHLQSTQEPEKISVMLPAEVPVVKGKSNKIKATRNSTDSYYRSAT